MKCIVAGSRGSHIAETEENYRCVEWAIKNSGFDIDTLICGMATGVDSMGYKWATLNKIPILEYPANWKLHGKAAGPLRNKQMSEVADCLIAILPSRLHQSKGTKNMIEISIKKKYPIKIFYLDEILEILEKEDKCITS